MKNILQGIRVLDFGRYISGPFSGMLLADMGAEVIKVEKRGGNIDRSLRPFTKDGKSMYVSTFARNKRCITVNFRTDEGKEILKKLVAKSDVIINNYRPGVMDKMGLSYENVKNINPRIIYSSISGFGQEGKYRDRAAFDGIAMAMSGVMSCNWLDGPRGLGTPIADITTGYVNTLAIMMALYHRERTGEGQFIDTAMVDSVSPFMETLIPTYYLTGVKDETSRRKGGDPTSAPANTFKAKDGYFYMHAGTDPHFNTLLNLIDLPEVKAALSDQKYQDHQTRRQDADEVERQVGKWIATMTMEEAEEKVSAAGIPCSVVNTVDRIINSPYAIERKQVVWIDTPEIGKVPYPGNPIKLSNNPIETFRPGEGVGESNEEIYKTLLNMSEEEIKDLKERKII